MTWGVSSSFVNVAPTSLTAKSEVEISVPPMTRLTLMMRLTALNLPGERRTGSSNSGEMLATKASMTGTCSSCKLRGMTGEVRRCFFSSVQQKSGVPGGSGMFVQSFLGSTRASTGQARDILGTVPPEVWTSEDTERVTERLLALSSSIPCFEIRGLDASPLTVEGLLVGVLGHVRSGDVGHVRSGDGDFISRVFRGSC